MKNLFKQTKMLEEARAQSGAHTPITEMFIFFLVSSVASLLQGFVMSPAFAIYIFSDKELLNLMSSSSTTFDDLLRRETELLANQPEWINVVTLFSSIAIIATVVIYCRFIEKRKLSTLGVRKCNVFAQYLIGLVIGTVMFTLIVGFGYAIKAFSFIGVENMSIAKIAVYFLGYVFNGASQVFLVYSYYMTSLSRMTSPTYAMFNSSIMFVLLHFSGAGISVVGYINMFIYALILGMYILKRGNIWGACAINSVWLFMQTTVFGFGAEKDKIPGILKFEISEGIESITGGSIGLWGGLLASFVLMLAVGAVFKLKQNEKEIAVIQNTPKPEGE